MKIENEIKNVKYMYIRIQDWIADRRVQRAERRMLKRLEYEDDWWWSMEQPGFFPPSYCREHTPEEIEKATQEIVKECREKIAEL